MKCPKCGSEHHCKNGIVKGRQRYKCKKCNISSKSGAKVDIIFGLCKFIFTQNFHNTSYLYFCT
jgi:hypothetical protein